MMRLPSGLSLPGSSSSEGDDSSDGLSPYFRRSSSSLEQSTQDEGLSPYFRREGDASEDWDGALSGGGEGTKLDFSYSSEDDERRLLSPLSGGNRSVVVHETRGRNGHIPSSNVRDFLMAQGYPTTDPPQLKYWFHHSSFLAGRNIAAAGEMLVIDGELRAISNESGHYMPTAGHLYQVLRQLQLVSPSFPFDKVEVLYFTGHEKRGSPPSGKHSAEEFMSFAQKGKWGTQYLHRRTSTTQTSGQPSQPKFQKQQRSDRFKGESKKSKTFAARIFYMRAATRARFEVTVDKAQNRLVTGGATAGSWLDTTGGGNPVFRYYNIKHLTDRFIYVMSREGRIYAADAISNIWRLNHLKPIFASPARS